MKHEKKLRALIAAGFMASALQPCVIYAEEEYIFQDSENGGIEAAPVNEGPHEFGKGFDPIYLKDDKWVRDHQEEVKAYFKENKDKITDENYKKAAEMVGVINAKTGKVEAEYQSNRARISGQVETNKADFEAAKTENPEAGAVKTPTLSGNTALATNATGSDTKIGQNVAGAKLPMLKISEDGKTVVNAEEDDGTPTKLSDINKQKLQEAMSQQENQTSNDSATSYQVQSSTGETVIVTKNPCYQKTTQACMQNYTYNYTDENGTYRTSQVPLSTLEYLAGSNKVTADMIQQARRQESYIKATNDALSSNSNMTVNPIETVTSSVRDMIAYGADPKEAIMSGLLAYASQLQSTETMKGIKEYGEGMKAIQKAKDDAVYSRTEDVQQTNGVLSAQKNKRFRPRLIPGIPVVNSEKPIELMLVTPTGQPNDTAQYKVFATVRNQKTKKIETFEVRENTPFIVEMPEWTSQPGRRNVQITYQFTNSAVKETYSFSYKVMQMSTAILPNGKAVSNSVTALASNRDILNYNAVGQAVAGRIKDVKWDNGTCFMEITDAKDNDNIKYPSVVVSSDKVEQSACTSALANKFISMENVTAKIDDNGQYVYVDNSDGDQVSIMNEAGYDSLEDDVAARTQYEGNNWDKNTLKVAEDGTIYEALPGKLGVNYLNLNLGSGKKVNVAVAVDPNTQSYIFAKADGTRYTEAELRSKGIDPSVISIGMDSSTNLLTAYDKNTKQVISNNQFDGRDTSNLSRKIFRNDDVGLETVNTDGSLTRNRITAALGETGSAVVGQAISTFDSMITGTTKAVTALTGNIASVGGGTFASLSTAALGNETAFSAVAKDAAQAEALKICSTVPDRCEEAMNAAK